VIEFAPYTGVRRGELCVLTWADIDFKSSRVNVSKTLSDDREVLPPKNGQTRSIVLAPQAAAALHADKERALNNIASAPQANR
jgi:integrase